MNRCFDVGIRLCPTCSDEEVEYVDDIPSISYNLLSALKESDIQKFSTFFTQIKDAAYIRLLSDIQIKFQEGKKFSPTVSETSAFSVSTDHTVLPINNVIQGYYTKLPYHRFTEYHVNKLGFFVHTAGDVEVVVIDMTTQEKLFSKVITLKKGINTVPIKSVISNEYQAQVFVGVKPITAILSAMKCGELEECGSCQYHEPCYCIQDCDCDQDIYGELLPCEVYKKENIEKKSIKYFCLDASVKCSFEKMICEYSEYFQEAYKYLVATFILNHKLNSYERNWYSDANIQLITDITLPEIRDYYYKLLMLGIGNIKGLTDDSICFECQSETSKSPLRVSLV